MKGEYWVAIVGPVELPKMVGGLDMPLRLAVTSAVVDTFGPDAYKQCSFSTGWGVTAETVEKIKKAMFTRENNEPNYRCVYCGLGFALREDYIAHVQESHYKPLQAKINTNADITDSKHNALHVDGFFCKYCGEQVAYGTFIEEEKCSYKNDVVRGLGCHHDIYPKVLPPLTTTSPFTSR